MQGLHRAVRCWAIGLLVAAVLAAGSGGAQAAPTTVPVAGSFTFALARDVGQGEAVGIINAVRRVPGGTVVYYSVGLRAGSPAAGLDPNSLGQITIGNYPGAAQAYLDVVDPVGLTRYRPMVGPAGCLCSSYADLPKQLVAGRLYSGFVVVPPLPARVQSVTVLGFFGAAVSNVPVGSGPLTPVAPTATTVSDLAAGWPTVPLDEVAQVADPGTYVLPLTMRTASLDNSEHTSQTARRVNVDLASDVLFAVDRSQLTPAARSRIAAIAADIVRRGTGPVTVTGYTDSTGSPAHNLTLSRARAAAVLAALKAGVGDAAVTFTSSGRGESDPVASNGTAAGRALNRRVSIDYGVTGAGR